MAESYDYVFIKAIYIVINIIIIDIGFIFMVSIVTVDVPPII